MESDFPPIRIPYTTHKTQNTKHNLYSPPFYKTIRKVTLLHQNMKSKKSSHVKGEWHCPFLLPNIEENIFNSTLRNFTLWRMNRGNCISMNAYVVRLLPFCVHQWQKQWLWRILWWTIDEKRLSHKIFRHHELTLKLASLILLQSCLDPSYQFLRKQ